jgi:hypothetical protein
MLHPILEEKLTEALLPEPRLRTTLRDARLPSIPGKVHAVIGMRRAGKTTFLKQLLADRRTDLPPGRAVYLSFDDERLDGIQVDQLGSLFEEYYRRHAEYRGREVVHWFLDEIQFVPDWDRFVRRVLDSELVEIVVSGSSARMLSREVHTSLRGRGLPTVIRPFSFREFLRHRGEEPGADPRRLSAAERSLVEQRLREYLVVGGFPEAQGLAAPLRIELLQGYVDSVVFRDVVQRHGLTQVSALRWIVRQCLRNPAGGFSAHRLHLDLRGQGLGVAKDAVHAMLEHLSDAFLISAAFLATDSERRRHSNPRKIYPADPGLIAAFDTSGRANLGHALETVVFNELERRGAEIGYVRTADGREVDFLVRHRAGGEELIQVCANLSETAVRERELSAIASAAAEFPRAGRRLLVLEQGMLVGADTREVTVQPVHEWLLEAPAQL